MIHDDETEVTEIERSVIVMAMQIAEEAWEKDAEVALESGNTRLHAQFKQQIVRSELIRAKMEAL